MFASLMANGEKALGVKTTQEFQVQRMKDNIIDKV